MQTHYMQTPSEVFLFVTHIEADDIFLKIWGQTDKRTGGEVEHLINSLTPHFNQGYGCPLKVTRSIVGELCCAKFQNDGYFRATILDARSDGIVVYFIDYGNTEVVLPHEVHLLSGIPGSEHLKAIPPMATGFILGNVLPKNGIWDNETIGAIKSYLCYNEYKISIYTINNRYMIQLWFNNEDFSKILVNDNRALPATIQDMFSMHRLQPRVALQPPPQIPQQPQQPMMAYQQRNKTNMTTMMSMIQNQNISHNTNAQALIHKTSSDVNYQKHPEPQPPPVQEALVFKSRVLNVDTRYEVCVSHVEDGPQKFSVQVNSTVPALKQLMDDIQRHPKKPLVEPPLPGSVCLGLYSDGNVLCRAVVMSVMEDKCKLYCVDFGHTTVLPYSDIFQLPPEYINPKVLSIRFTLSGLSELHITPELKECFTQLVSRKLLVLHVRPPEGPPLIQYGDLYDNGVNIKDILKTTFPKPNTTNISPSFSYLHLPQLMKDTLEMVSVPYIESCKKFFVQLESGLQSLESVSEALHKYVKTAPTLSTLKVGLPCAALYKSQWYRAEIINIDGNNIKVFYVDYGNEEELSVMSLRTIHPDLLKLPAQAIKCALNGYETLASDSDVTNHFERLVFEKRVFMKVVAAQPKGLLVDLFDDSMRNIHSQLLDNLFCDKTTENSIDTGFYDRNENSPIKSQNGEMHPAILANGLYSEDTNRYNKKKFADSNAFQDNKSNNWKDDWSPEKKYDNKYERNSYSSRDNSQNDRFTKDEGQNRFGRNRPYNRRDRNETNTFNRDGRGPPRGTDENRFSNYGHRHNRNSSDSDSSSNKGYGKHERGFNRSDRFNNGFRGREENRNSEEKWNESQTAKDWTDKGVAVRNKPYKYRNERFNGDYNNGNNKLQSREDNVTNLSYIETSEKWDTDDVEVPQNNILLNTTVLQFPSLDIAVGNVKKCVVSHANGPSDFFVNLQSNSNLIKMMESDICNIYTDGEEAMQTFEIQCDKCCVALDWECYKWGRAVIESVRRNNATVKFVDFGKTLSVDFAKLKVIREEFLNLPMQAIHCKMLGAPDTPTDEQNAIFTEKVARNLRGLEMEFVAVENGIHQVLIYDVVENGEPCSYINDQFWAKNMDLTKAKQIAPNQKVFEIMTRNLQAESNYVPSDSKWRTEFYEPGSKYDVTVSWFISPNKFYCQLSNKENEFKVMMKEIQMAYPDKKQAGRNIEIGSIVIARFPEDRALYRAEVTDKDPLGNYIVHYVDFGNYASVPLPDLYPVKEKFVQLPKMAVECSLKDVALDTSKFSSWSDVDINALDDCFNADKYECIFHNLRDNQYLVSLIRDRQTVADTLVQKHLAVSASQDFTDEVTGVLTTEASTIPTIDISLLPGQTLRMRISSVENAAQFYVQLPSASKCDEIVNKYMENNEAKILSLPGELASMQNQALKCSLHGVSASFEADQKLKNLEGQNVLVYVEEVNDDRLSVKLYDLLGNGVLNTEDNNEKISPICPLPILTSTCQVFLSYADRDTNLWMRRPSMDNDEIKLCRDLNEYYNNNSAQTLKPEEHLLCAVNNQNDQWQRGRIVSYNETTACVLFIDYGFINEVTLDSLKVLDPRFYEPHQLAVNASLSVALIGTQSEQTDILQLHLKDKTLTANFYNVHKSWIVELFENGEKISDKFRSLNIAKERSSELSDQTHDPSTSNRFNVYVPHLDSPSQFWIQRVDESTLLNEKLDQLQLDVSGFPAVDGVPEVGTYCAAVYDVDGLWYYAEVLDADEDITTVRFIDYGNTDVISNKADKIRQLPDSHKNLQILATKCRLDVIPIDTEDWSDSVYDRFLNLIQSAQSVQALILADTAPKRVDLFLDGKSVSETLVEETLAIKINTEQEPVDEIVDLELDPHSAFVSHLNSPSEFWIQEEKSVADLEVMADRFLVADMFSKVTENETEEGLLCVAKYPEDDQWYRARIISHNEDGIQVIYIDYGNSSTSTDIRIIPEDLASIPPLSRKCCLELPPRVKEWSKEACEEFVQLAADGATVFHLEVLKEQETSVIKLTLDGQNVADILALKCEQLPVIEERLPPLGEENLPNVVLSYIYSPDEFWIQAESDISELEVMSDRLGDAESFLTLNNRAVGTVCAAVYPEDGYWYRAKILERDDDATAATKVLYIDYGNCSVTEELRVLPEDIVNIPALSKRCTLEKPSHITSWSTKANEKFQELAAEGNTMFQFELLDEGDPMRVRLSLNGTNVVELLLAEDENISEIGEKTETDDRNVTSDTLEQQEAIFDHQPTSEDKETFSTHVQEPTGDRTDESNNLDSINQNLEKLEIKEYIDIPSEVTTAECVTSKEISTIAENKNSDIINDETIPDVSEAIPVESSFAASSLSVPTELDEITENMMKDTIPDLESQETNDTNFTVEDETEFCEIGQSNIDKQQVSAETSVFPILTECGNIPEVGEGIETDGEVISDTAEKEETFHYSTSGDKETLVLSTQTEQELTVDQTTDELNNINENLEKLEVHDDNKSSEQFNVPETYSEEQEANKDLDIASDETARNVNEEASCLVSSPIRTELSVDEIIENMIKDSESQISDANLSTEYKMQGCEIAQTQYTSEPSTESTRDVSTNVTTDLDTKISSELNESQPSSVESREEQKVHPDVRQSLLIAEVTCSSERQRNLTRDNTVSESSKKTDTSEMQSGSEDNDSSTEGSIFTATATKSLEKVISFVTDSAEKCSHYTRKVLKDKECASRSESPKPVETTVESQKWTPSTPKTPHSEKLVAAVVNPIVISDSDSANEDEVLTISVESDIPKHAV